MIDPNTIHSQPRFIDMRNTMHMDEKWYNGTKKNKTMYCIRMKMILIGQCRI